MHRMDPKALHARLADAANASTPSPSTPAADATPSPPSTPSDAPATRLFSRRPERRRLRGAAPVPLRAPHPAQARGRAGPLPEPRRRRVEAPGRARADEVARRPSRHAVRGRALAARPTSTHAIDRALRLLDVARVGERGARVPQARREELLAPARSYFYEECLDELRQQTPEDAPRGGQGLLGGEARGRSPRGERREGDGGRRHPDDGRRAVVLEGRYLPAGVVRGHHADELHLRDPRDPDRRLLPERLADDLQGAPVQRDHEQRRWSA